MKLHVFGKPQRFLSGTSPRSARCLRLSPLYVLAPVPARCAYDAAVLVEASRNLNTPPSSVLLERTPSVHATSIFLAFKYFWYTEDLRYRLFARLGCVFCRTLQHARPRACSAPARVPLCAGPIPKDLGALADLRVLYLPCNKLAGERDPITMLLFSFVEYMSCVRRR